MNNFDTAPLEVGPDSPYSIGIPTTCLYCDGPVRAYGEAIGYCLNCGQKFIVPAPSFERYTAAGLSPAAARFALSIDNDPAIQDEGREAERSASITRYLQGVDDAVSFPVTGPRPYTTLPDVDGPEVWPSDKPGHAAHKVTYTTTREHGGAFKVGEVYATCTCKAGHGAALFNGPIARRGCYRLVDARRKWSLRPIAGGGYSDRYGIGR